MSHKIKETIPEHLGEKYKKSWLVNAYIAREIAGFSLGSRLPTIQEFTEKLHSSRGIVQNSLERLQEKGGISLTKHGKMGTCITSLCQEILFREGGLEYLTATMPSPLNPELVSLASGICLAMSDCPVSFNFAFIQSAGKRGLALSRKLYDFAITSYAAACKLCAEYPDLAIMMKLEGCTYSPPYVLCSNRPGVVALSAGDRIAADPSAIDQYMLTKKLCKTKKVTLIERPYITCRALFMSGDIDFLVYRHEPWIREANVTVSPIENKNEQDYLIPTVLINRNNYNIANILKPYLCSPIIAEGQSAVLEHRREPIIF